MRRNEYRSLKEFSSEYTGEWAPSDGHWFGLDFLYKGKIYRLHTGQMYKGEITVFPDGREVTFGLYKRVENQKEGYPDMTKCELLGKYADMQDLLESTVIDNRPFREVIMDDDTELLGKD